MQPNNTDPSISDKSYTYAYSSYSCLEFVYPIHVTLAYLVGICGLLACLSRVIPALLPYHVWFGRFFMIFMWWCIGASLLIHNTGLFLPIIVFMLVVLVGMSIGWVAIKFHNEQMEKAAYKRVEEQKKELIDLASMVLEKKNAIAAGKSFKERLISWKALHGVCMVLAWGQMVGRIFVSNPVKPRGYCFTYPAYKNDNGVAVFLPQHDPDNPLNGTEVSFILMVLLPMFFLIVIVGVCYSFYESRKSKRESSSVFLSSETVKLIQKK